jgi:hypothetical protein
LYLLQWHQTIQNNSKKERETLQKIPAKGKRRKTHVMLSFPPLFNTELKANKESLFPR